MKKLIKLPFKIAALLLVPVFFLLSLAMKFFAWASGRIFALLSLLIGIGGAVLLFQGNTIGGVILIAAAFLISPMGVPLFAEATGKLLDGLNGSLIGFIRG